MTPGAPHDDVPAGECPSDLEPLAQATPSPPRYYFQSSPSPRPGEVHPYECAEASATNKRGSDDTDAAPDAKRSKNEDLPHIIPTLAGSVAIRIEHILWTIVTACDFRSVLYLSLTSKYVHKVVNTGRKNPAARYAHLFVHAHSIGGRFHHVRVNEMFNSPPLCDPYEFLRRDVVDGELLNTTIDYLGPTRSAAQPVVEDLIPNCVRFQFCACHFSGCSGCSSILDSVGGEEYPLWVSRARCLVAFPFYLDGWSVDINRCLTQSDDDIRVYVDSPWVFDRVVYHPWYVTDHDGNMTKMACGPTIPNVGADAWHTVFLLPTHKWSGSTSYEVVLDRVAYVSAVALQKRVFVPGAHVTIVSNVDTVLPNMPQGPYGRHDRPRFHAASLEVVFRDAVAAYLADRTLQSDPDYKNDDEFIAEAIAAIKFKSWAQYEASITPRQWEIENIQ